MWNPLRYRYTPVKNRGLRVLVALALLPLQLVFWIVVSIHNGTGWILERIVGSK